MCIKFREQVWDKKPYISAQRAVLATEAYKANQNQPSVMKKPVSIKVFTSSGSNAPPFDLKLLFSQNGAISLSCCFVSSVI